MTEKPLNIEKTKLDIFKEGMLSKIYDGTIKNVWFDTDIKDYRIDDIWFNDTVFQFDYKNLEVRVTFYNDVKGEITLQNQNEPKEINDGDFGGRLKELGINKDSDFTTDYDAFKNEKNDKNEPKFKAFIKLEDNNWAELVIYNNETEKYIENYEAYSLSEFIDMRFDGFLNLVKEYSKDELNEKFESKEEGSSYKFIQQCDYVKAQKTFCDYLNLRCELLENKGVENIKHIEDWIKTEYKDARNKNYTIEAMFKSRGVSKVFDDKGIFTEEALKAYDEVANEFFNGDIDNLDKLCSEEKCFEENIKDIDDDVE